MERLRKAPLEVAVRWAGRSDRGAMPDGVYRVRMRAVADDASGEAPPDHSGAAIAAALAAGQVVEQAWDLALGDGQRPRCRP